MFVIGGGRLEKALFNILENLDNKRNEAVERIKTYLDLSAEVDRLQNVVGDLKIEKSTIEEKYARREREIEHKLGLERQRQEQELVLKEREVTVKLREENLTADKKRFEDQMKFMTDRMVAENNQLQGMIKPLLEALPKMTIKENIGTSRKR
jgi:predicted nuclease with TOPRIM domain